MDAAPPLTPLGISALALLAERPMHPYEMYQVLTHRGEDRIVKVRPGSLYHTVERLERSGLVRSLGTERAGNRPERTSYEITEDGRQAFTEWVAEVIATPVNEYPGFPLAISQAHNLSAETVIGLLEGRLALLAAELDALRRGGDTAGMRHVPPLFWVDVTYQQAMVHAEIAWIENLVADIRSGRMSWAGHKTEQYGLSPESAPDSSRQQSRQQSRQPSRQQSADTAHPTRSRR